MPALNSAAHIRFLLTAVLCGQMALPSQLIAQQPTPQNAQSPMRDSGMQNAGNQTAMPVEPPPPPAELPMQRVNLNANPVVKPLPIEQRYQLVLVFFIFDRGYQLNIIKFSCNFHIIVSPGEWFVTG